ncbi:prostaglandin reductase 1-like isoform X2 [Haliotis rufescens]|uniref:prostaglandin reductase 1-like isoform X2 n=1 Tax=Haliotis rufescens TaxID=6454 RepID=UPI00201EE804|nr:prostaglandin reductase 1-like isoform X2 [Haliotis rufescens]
MMKAKTWVIAKLFDGEPTESNFRLIEEEVPSPKQGEFVCEALYLSVSPYESSSDKAPLGSALMGHQVSRVTDTKNSEYPVGTLIQCYSGWRSRSLINPKENPEALKLLKVPNLAGKEPSLALGVMGIPGVTAYRGLLEVCEPKAGDTVLVSGAAGAVGSVVGQIAKIKGCKVIGFGGSKEKCDWLKSLGFDHVFNYKEVNLDDALTSAAPNGVDCFFDSVGGEVSCRVLQHMNDLGRVCVSGAMSSYNYGDKQPLMPSPFHACLYKRLKIQGFSVSSCDARFEESRTQIFKWMNEDKVKYKEEVQEGFEKMPKAFLTALKGKVAGKIIVKV